MVMINSKKKSKRIFYFDALRALAICSVIIFHVFTGTNYMVTGEFDVIPSINWIISCFLGANKVGVDIFLMLSGALSLGRHWDIKSFLSKRIPRITLPFLFWGFIITLFMFLVLMYNPSILGNHITTVSSFSLESFLQYLYNSYMSLNKGCSQYWFFWMILGTYLIMPILNKWLLYSDLKEAEYFIVLWLITCIFDVTLGQEFPIQLTYFSGGIGLVVLGYYLRHTNRKLLNNQYFALFLLIIGILTSMLNIYLNSDISNSSMFFNDRLSIYLIIEVIGIFLLFKNFNKFNLNLKFIKNPNGIFRKSIFSIAKYSYGMYLIHLIIKNILITFLKPHFDYISLIILLIIGTILISWGILAVLNRIPYLNQVIGAK